MSKSTSDQPVIIGNLGDIPDYAKNLSDSIAHLEKTGMEFLEIIDRLLNHSTRFGGADGVAQTTDPCTSIGLSYTVMPVANRPAQISSGAHVNLRQCPSDDTAIPVIEVLEILHNLTVIGEILGQTWYLVVVDGSGNVGWIRHDLVVFLDFQTPIVPLGSRLLTQDWYDVLISAGVIDNIASFTGYGNVKVWQDPNGFYWFEPVDPANSDDVYAVILAYSLYFAHYWGEPDAKHNKHPLVTTAEDPNNPCVTEIYSVFTAMGWFNVDPTKFHRDTVTLKDMCDADPRHALNIDFRLAGRVPIEADRTPHISDVDWESIVPGSVVFDMVGDVYMSHVTIVVGWGDPNYNWWHSTKVALYATHNEAINAGIANPVPYVVDRGVAGPGHAFRGPRPFDDLRGMDGAFWYQHWNSALNEWENPTQTEIWVAGY